MAPARDRIVTLHFASLDSTQIKARELLKTFDRESLAVITADLQTAGRGRQGRSWTSGEGNLAASFITFRKQNAPIENSCQLLALTAAEALLSLAVPIALKWPNDLMLNGLKVGGVLTEVVDSFVINGIGINLASCPEGCAFVNAERSELLTLLKESYNTNWSLYQKGGFTPFFHRFQKLFPYKRGDALTFHAPNGKKVKGSFEAISESGALTLRIEGTLQQFFSGDILQND